MLMSGIMTPKQGWPITRLKWLENERAELDATPVETTLLYLLCRVSKVLNRIYLSLLSETVLFKRSFNVFNRRPKTVYSTFAAYICMPARRLTAVHGMLAHPAMKCTER